MMRYYNFTKFNSIFEFTYDLITLLFLLYFSMNFIIVCWRIIREQFIDTFKIIQYVLIWIMTIRFLLIFILRLSMDEEDTKYFVIFIEELLNSRMVYFWVIQLSWFVLYKHLIQYKSLSWGFDYETWKQNIRKAEVLWSIVIFFGNFIVNLIWLTINLLSKEENSNPITILNDLIVITLNVILAINELRMYRKIIYAMEGLLWFYSGSYRINLLSVSLIDFWLFLVMITKSIFQVVLTWLTIFLNKSNEKTSAIYILDFILITLSFISNMCFMVYRR